MAWWPSDHISISGYPSTWFLSIPSTNGIIPTIILMISLNDVWYVFSRYSKKEKGTEGSIKCMSLQQVSHWSVAARHCSVSVALAKCSSVLGGVKCDTPHWETVGNSWKLFKSQVTKFRYLHSMKHMLFLDLEFCLKMKEWKLNICRTVQIRCGEEKPRY